MSLWVIEMTPTEFKEKMIEIADEFDEDEELRHIKADELMCELLADLGYGEGVEVFECMSKWYA